MEAVQESSLRGARKRWLLIRRQPHQTLAEIAADSPLLAQLLFNRGLRDASAAHAFLTAANAPVADPWALAGVPAAVERLQTAIAAGELIAIYGDYDVDGLTATAVLFHALTRLGARLLPFIPHRILDGYGLQEGPLRRLRADGATLIVTVDCGVSATSEIEAATALGLDVIVTDHHLAPEVLPSALAIVNPRRSDDGYPFKPLAGVGVAHRLASALLGRALGPQAAPVADELIDLVAIGTVSDVMPLEGENRTQVQQGLERLRRRPRLGLAALMSVAGLESAQLSAEDIAFGIAPRLNAAGRIDHARIALDLLLAQTDSAAADLAQQLQLLNRERQEQTDRALERAREIVAAQPLAPGVVVAGDFPLGVVGLVAARLVEEFGRPALVLSVEGNLARGSARSVSGVNVVEALAGGSIHLTKFGGHAMAAGCSLPAERVPRLAEAFSDDVERQLGGEPLEPTFHIDAELQPSTANSFQVLELLSRLEPCGAGNPAPVFLTRSLKLLKCEPTTNGQHLQVTFFSPSGILRGVAFRTDAPPCEIGASLDVVYRLKRNVWNGLVSPRLEVLDWSVRQPDNL